MAISAFNMYHACRANNPDYICGMSKLISILLLVAALALASGCCHKHSGSREFIPGKGWVPTD
jgi:hypothetical protein